MLPSKVSALLTEVVTHRRREHHTEVDKVVRDFLFKMVRQKNDQSSAFNDGKVRIYCEAFEKYAAAVWEAMQRVLAGGFEVYPDYEDDLIGFLKESLSAVYEDDTKSLFTQKNVAVHKVIATHLAQCKPRFEFHCRAVTEKLSTEIKNFANQLRVMKEKGAHQAAGEGNRHDSYEAVIEGEKIKLNSNCFDAEGKTLELANGQRYVFELLNFNPPGQPREEPDGDIFCYPLIEVVKLQPGGDDWKWNDEVTLLSQWLEAEGEKIDVEARKSINRFQRMNQLAFEHPLFIRRSMVQSRLKELPADIQKTVRGIAWFKQNVGIYGEETPILLKSFRPLPSNTKPKPSKTTRPRLPKPSARFENDFAVAVIPQKKGKELSPTVELELRQFVKQLIEAGGRVPRTVLRKTRSDWRPEKMLESATAKKLVKAGLLGRDKVGRATTFWAKQRAD